MDQISKTVSIQELAPVLVQKVNNGGTAEITVTGRSMLPLLLDRKSRVRLAALTEPKRGDMVLYRRTSGTYVLHRIVRCEANGTYTMCGDGQNVLEFGLHREQLLAKVTSFARRSRWRDCTDPVYGLWWRIHVWDRPLRRFRDRGMGYLRRHLLHK